MYVRTRACSTSRLKTSQSEDHGPLVLWDHLTHTKCRTSHDAYHHLTQPHYTTLHSHNLTTPHYTHTTSPPHTALTQPHYTTLHSHNLTTPHYTHTTSPPHTTLTQPHHPTLHSHNLTTPHCTHTTSPPHTTLAQPHHPTLHSHNLTTPHCTRTTSPPHTTLTQPHHPTLHSHNLTTPHCSAGRTSCAELTDLDDEGEGQWEGHYEEDHGDKKEYSRADGGQQASRHILILGSNTANIFRRPSCKEQWPQRPTTRGKFTPFALSFSSILLRQEI